MKLRYLGISALVVMIALAGVITFRQSAIAGGCYMPRVAMRGTVEPKSAVYMRSMPCMEEGVRMSIVRPGTSFSVSEYSDGWYKLETPTGEQGYVYAPNRLTNINTYEVSESDSHTTTPVVRKPIFSSLKFKRALATINKNYSDAEIVSLVEHFTAIKDEAPELAPMVDYAVEMLQK